MLLLQVQGWGESTKEGLQVYKPASEGPRHQVHTCAWVPLWSSKIPAGKGFSPQGFCHRGKKKKVQYREFEITEHSECYQSLHFIHSTILKIISKMRKTKHWHIFDNIISIAVMHIHCPCCGVCLLQVTESSSSPPQKLRLTTLISKLWQTCTRSDHVIRRLS